MGEKIIISCTSYGKRLDNLKHVILSIECNTVRPDYIVVNLAEGEVVPEKLQSFFDGQGNVIVNRVPDTKVWKKFLPTFKLFPDDIIICIDDDFIYPNGMIEDFVNTYKANPKQPVSGNRVDWYGLKCHCGCASLVKKEFFEGIEITEGMMANCMSSDFAYTWLLAQKGVFYQRTKSKYFYNMPSLKHADSWTNDNNRSRIVPNTLAWLEKNCEVKYDVHTVIQNKPDIYYNVPYNSDKNIGKAYNTFASIVPKGAWICFMDADTIPTTPDYGTLIENIITANPKVEAFTCVTNRIGCPWQIAEGSDWGNDDMRYHRQFGLEQKNKYNVFIEDVTDKKHVMSGHFMCIKKAVWDKIGGAPEKGMLGVDNEIHRRIKAAGIRLYLAKGLYVYHWYRGGDKTDTTHLK